MPVWLLLRRELLSDALIGDDCCCTSIHAAMCVCAQHVRRQRAHQRSHSTT
jgi:hypothetical protein